MSRTEVLERLILASDAAFCLSLIRADGTRLGSHSFFGVHPVSEEVRKDATWAITQGHTKSVLRRNQQVVAEIRDGAWVAV